ncbi:phage baseplate assembly protein V (plasmid) [Kitasatospora sp. NBC_00070]|uniref:phage baseplate assembly protein V n=1 Tax=Kitasatospora sp. NBC_00070 TaxID=2975962 RepID=UPI0032543FA3
MIVVIAAGTPRPLLPNVQAAVEKVVVDLHTHLPGMFEVTFLDDDGVVALQAGITIGQSMSIKAPGGSLPLIIGDITSIETVCEGMRAHTVVRGYERAHRLQRVKKSRSWMQQTDATIATEIAISASLIPDVSPSPIVHAHISQFDQTDWDFLSHRAREIGYELAVHDLRLSFKPSTGTPVGAAAASANAVASGAVMPLVFKENLISFSASLSSANITPMVEVRAADRGLAMPWTGMAPTLSTSAVVPATPAQLAVVSNGISAPMPPSPRMTLPFATNALAVIPPNPNAYVVTDRPVSSGPLGQLEAQVMAMSLADQIGSTFADAEGYAEGDPSIKPGSPVTVMAVPKQFMGMWHVTQARHVFDDEIGGYFTRFWVTGRQNRSLLNIASAGSLTPKPPRVNGVVLAIVTNNCDNVATDGMGRAQGRVKLAFPWLSPNYESDWAPVVQPGAGMLTGTYFMPSVNDQVLVAFEHGDIRKPFVLGGIIDQRSAYINTFGGLPPGPPILPGTGTVRKRGIMSPGGNQLVFTDQQAAGGGPSLLSSVSLTTRMGTMGLDIEPDTGLVTLKNLPGDSKMPAAISITALPNGMVTVSGGVINVTATQTLNMKAPVVNIAADSQLGLTSTGPVTINGAAINLNA